MRQMKPVGKNPCTIVYTRIFATGCAPHLHKLSIGTRERGVLRWIAALTLFAHND